MTPIEMPLEYGQEVEKKTRKVTYWDTHPGLSLFITIISLGVYLPFSFIPVDIDTSLEPRDSYKDNAFTVVIETEGYQKWEEVIMAKGQKTISLKPQFKNETEK